MKQLHLVVLLLPLLFYNKSVAQTNPKDSLIKNHLFVDVHGGLWTQGSLNYERYIASKQNVKLYGKFGLGYSEYLFHYQGPGILAGLTMLTGKKNSHFEVSAGAFLIQDTDLYIHPMVNVGYRYQKPEGGFIFKSFLGPVGIGIGMGHAFRQ